MAKSKQQQSQDAREAERLLNDEALNRACDEIMQGIFDDFSVADTGDVDELLRLQSEMKGVNALRRRLRIWLEAGKIAEKNAK